MTELTPEEQLLLNKIDNNIQAYNTETCKYKRYPLKSMFTFPKPIDISWNRWIRWHLWEIIEYQFFYPLIFHDKRAGRWTAIQLAKLYCYVGVFLLQ